VSNENLTTMVFVTLKKGAQQLVSNAPQDKRKHPLSGFTPVSDKKICVPRRSSRGKLVVTMDDESTQDSDGSSEALHSSEEHDGNNVSTRRLSAKFEDVAVQERYRKRRQRSCLPTDQVLEVT
jgi:hypothetical protein